MNHRRVDMPPPRAHLAGTLRALEIVAALGGGAVPDAVRALLDRPGDLPASVPPEAAALKYDLYLTAAARPAWGVTLNDTWEPEAFRRALDHFLGPRAAAVARIADALGPVPATTCGLGFDDPTGPPRVKVYLEEARWGAGLTDAARLRRVAADLLGVVVPDWLGDRPLGVVTVELNPDGSTGLKVYPGADHPAAAAAGIPGAGPLADTLARACPGPGWYYATVRLRADAPPRVAMNKIVNVVQAAFAAGVDPEAAWTEVEALFALAGRSEVLRTLRARLRHPDLHVVPTATAVEDEGRSVDVYVGAWARPPVTGPG